MVVLDHATETVVELAKVVVKGVMTHAQDRAKMVAWDLVWGNVRHHANQVVADINLMAKPFRTFG